MRVFDLRQKFNSIAFRVSGMEPQITERIIILKNDLMNKIKKNNSGQNAKAAKYAGAGLSGGKKFFIFLKIKKVFRLYFFSFLTIY